MKTITPLLLVLLLILSCGEQRNYDGSPKNYTQISLDTACSSIGIGPLIIFDSLSFQIIADTVANKLVALLGNEAFTEEAQAMIKDSLHKQLFALDTHMLRNEFMLFEKDTATNAPRNQSMFYSQYTRRLNCMPGTILFPTSDMSHINFNNIDILYTIYSCYTLLDDKADTLMRERKGALLPPYSKGSVAHLDPLLMRRAKFSVQIILSIDDNRGLINEDRQHYEIRLTDTGYYLSSLLSGK